jgi:hypothetical protein
MISRETQKSIQTLDRKLIELKDLSHQADGQLLSTDLDSLSALLIRIPRSISFIFFWLVPILLASIFYLKPQFREILNFTVLVFTASAGSTAEIYFARNSRNDSRIKRHMLNIDFVKAEIEWELQKADRISNLELARQARTVDFIHQ